MGRIYIPQAANGLFGNDVNDDALLMNRKRKRQDSFKKAHSVQHIQLTSRHHFLERKAPSSTPVVHKQVSDLNLCDLTQIDQFEHFKG